MEDFSTSPPVPENSSHPSKLDPFKPLIGSWLEADQKAPVKQRHTARRIHKRLGQEADRYECSYRLVAAYVTEKKKVLCLTKQGGYIPLEHHLGEACILRVNRSVFTDK